jgi:alpha-ketoglutarate-dependent taurine dioxygenase
MKITKIPNFGSFGVYVDDIDMNTITKEEWIELGKLFVKELLVVFRNINIDKRQYAEWVPQLGPVKSNVRVRFYKKYGSDLDATKPETWGEADENDFKWLSSRQHQLEDIGDGKFLTRIYGRRDSEGNSLGYFSHGEVYWHSNESSSLTFSPAVSLLGWEHMGGSATGFVQTVDLYESFSESFRSELDEMILVHKYTPGKINEDELSDEVQSLHMKMMMCPEDGSETPLICQAPNGRKGLRYTVNTCVGIKGMSETDTQNLFQHLDKLIFDKNNIYDHFYDDTRKDLLMFDNSVTLHRRLGGQEDRKAFRMQFDLSPLLEQPWTPWIHTTDYHHLYINQCQQLVDAMGGDVKARFKLPNIT